MFFRRAVYVRANRLAFAVAYANLIGLDGDRRDSAEDLASETVSVVARWIGKETLKRGMRPRLREIAKYTSAVAYKSSKRFWRRHREHAALTGFDIAAPNNDPNEILELIDRAVVDPRGRAMLRMHVLDTSEKPRPVREYSRQLNLSPSTGCRVWNRSLEAVRAFLEERGFDVPDRVIRSNVDDDVD